MNYSCLCCWNTFSTFTWNKNSVFFLKTLIVNPSWNCWSESGFLRRRAAAVVSGAAVMISSHHKRVNSEASVRLWADGWQTVDVQRSAAGQKEKKKTLLWSRLTGKLTDTHQGQDALQEPGDTEQLSGTKVHLNQQPGASRQVSQSGRGGGQTCRRNDETVREEDRVRLHRRLLQSCSQHLIWTQLSFSFMLRIHLFQGGSFVCHESRWDDASSSGSPQPDVLVTCRRQLTLKQIGILVQNSQSHGLD